MSDNAQLAQAHWHETPLFVTGEERYSTYPWLYEVAEFRKHHGRNRENCLRKLARRNNRGVARCGNTSQFAARRLSFQV
jgi:hypothetical protein